MQHCIWKESRLFFSGIAPWIELPKKEVERETSFPIHLTQSRPGPARAQVVAALRGRRGRGRGRAGGF